MRTETTLTHAEARTAIDAIASACAPKGLTAVIAVADNHGELIGLLRLAGAPLASVQIAANKAYSAARERKPSREIGAASKRPVSGFEITSSATRVSPAGAAGCRSSSAGNASARSPSAVCWRTRTSTSRDRGEGDCGSRRRSRDEVKARRGVARLGGARDFDAASETQGAGAARRFEPPTPSLRMTCSTN